MSRSSQSDSDGVVFAILVVFFWIGLLLEIGGNNPGLAVVPLLAWTLPLIVLDS